MNEPQEAFPSSYLHEAPFWQWLKELCDFGSSGIADFYQPSSKVVSIPILIVRKMNLPEVADKTSKVLAAADNISREIQIAEETGAGIFSEEAILPTAALITGADWVIEAVVSRGGPYCTCLFYTYNQLADKTNEICHSIRFKEEWSQLVERYEKNPEAYADLIDGFGELQGFGKPKEMYDEGLKNILRAGINNIFTASAQVYEPGADPLSLDLKEADDLRKGFGFIFDSTKQIIYSLGNVPEQLSHHLISYLGKSQRPVVQASLSPTIEPLINPATNLETVKNQIKICYDKRSAHSSNCYFQPFVLPQDDQPESTVSKFLGTGGSLHISNDNSRGELRWRVYLPLPIGIPVLAIYNIIHKIREWRNPPNELGCIADSLRLFLDSHTRSLTLPGIQNFFKKNFNGLSKEELQQVRGQELITLIQSAIQKNLGNLNLLREGKYIICAIKNHSQEMLENYSSSESHQTIAQRVEKQYWSYLKKDFDDFFLLKTPAEKFRSAKQLADKYPLESHIQAQLAEAAQHVKKYDLALEALECCRSQRLRDLSFVQKQQENTSFASRPEQLYKNVNTQLDYWKKEILYQASHNAPDSHKQGYKSQLLDFLKAGQTRDPSSLFFNQELVNFYREEQQITQAIPHQIKLVELMKTPDAYIQLADLHFKNADSTAGFKVLECMATFFPAISRENYDAQCYLREFYLEQGNYTQALEHAKTAAQSRFATSVDDYQKGFLYQALGEKDLAKQDLISAKNKNDKDQLLNDVYQLAIDAFLKQGQEEPTKAISIRKLEAISLPLKKQNKATKIASVKKSPLSIQQLDAVCSLLSLLINIKLHDTQLDKETRKVLVALSTFVRGGAIIRTMQQANWINLNNILTSIATICYVLKEFGCLDGLAENWNWVKKGVDHAPEVCAFLGDVAYLISLGSVISTESLVSLIPEGCIDITSAVSVACSAISAVSCLFRLSELGFRTFGYQLYDNYEYHFVKNSLSVVPIVAVAATKLGVFGFATGKIAAGFAIVQVDPITGVGLILTGAGTLGSVSYATYKGIEYSSEADRKNALLYNAQLLAKEENYFSAICKLNEYLSNTPNPEIEKLQGYYYCQYHIKEKNYEALFKEVGKWLQKPELEKTERCRFLNYHIVASLKQSEFRDLEQTWTLYTESIPDEKLRKVVSENKQKTAVNLTDEQILSNNMFTLICKSAMEIKEPKILLQTLKRAMSLNPEDPSLKNWYYAVDFDIDLQDGKQGQLLGKCKISLQNNPRDTLALKYSGLVTLEQKKYLASEYYFNLWAKEEPKNAYPFFCLSKSFLFKEDFVQAEKNARKAMELAKTIYNEKQVQGKSNNEQPIEQLNQQYQELKTHYNAIQQGIVNLYSCAFAQAAGKVSAQMVGLMVNKAGERLFSHQTPQTLGFSFRLWQKPGSQREVARFSSEQMQEYRPSWGQ